MLANEFFHRAEIKWTNYASLNVEDEMNGEELIQNRIFFHFGQIMRMNKGCLTRFTCVFIIIHHGN